MNSSKSSERKREEELRERLTKEADPNQPVNIVKFQHQLAQNLLKEQHALNLEIHEKQAKLTRSIALWSILATLLGVCLGALLAKL